MFEKVILDIWEKNGITYLISINDDGVLFFTERVEATK